MTRETKVGMIVACSFLCLVGVVVASKWNRAETPSADPEEQTIVPKVAAVVHPAQNAKASETKKKDDPKKVASLPTLPHLPTPPERKDDKPAPLMAVPPPLPGESADPIKLPPLVGLPAEPANDPGVAKELKKQRDLALAQASPAPPPIGPKVDPPSGLPALPVPPPTGPNLPLPTPPAPSPFALPPGPLAPDGDKKKDAPVPVPAGGITSPLPSPLPPVPIEQKKEAGPATVTFPPLDKKDGLPGFPPIEKKENPLPLPPIDKTDAFPGVPPIEKKDAFPGVPPIEKKDTTLTFPPIGEKVAPLTFPPVEKKDVPLTFPPIDKKNNPPAFAPLDNAQPKPIPVIPSTELPSAPAISTTPGVVGSATMPAIRIGGNPAMPVVKDVKIDFHEAKPGENTFDILSLRLYGTEKYADALKAYNQAHSGMIKNGTFLNVNPPILNPGQQVMIAPTAVLERDYGALIKSPTLTQATAPGPGKLSVPTPIIVSPPVVQTSPSVPAIAAGRNYTVQNPQGESILDIAERVLGDRTQWHRIYRVNPNYPPQYRIPVGTSLILPTS